MLFKKNIFPFYHTVSDKNLPHISNLYPLKSIDQFQRELDFFQKNYTDISLMDLLALSKNGKLKDNNFFHLTFDDGLMENATIISPILKERNLNATFFINPNFIGNEAIFYRYKIALIIEKCKNPELIKKLLTLTIHDSEMIDNLLKEYSISLQNINIYMNESEINSLIEKGFTIGAHSLTHPYYKHISFEEQKKQTNESIAIIQKKFNLSYNVFSFPFTDDGVSRELFQHIQADLTFGTAGVKDDEIRTQIQRLPMDNLLGNPNVFIFKNLLSYRLKKIIGKHLVKHE
ncbi:MAG: polysaccharide deacetylase family protein [Flavobacteriaceae bacterium]|nr:polysaccharide deacetylase family protein [Candidatus Onthonaster equi]